MFDRMCQMASCFLPKMSISRRHYWRCKETIEGSFAACKEVMASAMPVCSTSKTCTNSVPRFENVAFVIELNAIFSLKNMAFFKEFFSGLDDAFLAHKKEKT